MSGGSFVDFSLIWILMKFLQPYLDLLVTYFYFNRCEGKLLYNLYAKWGPLGAEQQGFFCFKTLQYLTAYSKQGKMYQIHCSSSNAWHLEDY